MDKEQVSKIKYKTVVITGAGSGLGRALAHKFYQADFNVCLIGRDKKNLEETSRLFDPARKIIIPCDIRKYNEVKKAFKKIFVAFRQIDVLINNAGIFRMLPIEKTSPAIWEDVLKTNTFGTFFCTKEALSLLKKPKTGGKIINILSIIIEKDLPFNTAYAASKYAILGLMNSLKEELKGKNIFISNISPGRINTGVWNKKETTKIQSPVELAEIIFSISAQKTTLINNISLSPFD